MLKNPLRVLDSKREQDQAVINRAPVISDFLNNDSNKHFQIVQEGLSMLGIEYELTPRLVRGLDYYTKTTFEFVAPNLDAAQNAVEEEAAMTDSLRPLVARPQKASVLPSA